MCLAVPAEVISLDQGVARVNVGGSVGTCFVDAVPEVEVGDYVLMHAGYAIAILSISEAEETLRLLKEAYGEGSSDAVLGSGPGPIGPG